MIASLSILIVFVIGRKRCGSALILLSISPTTISCPFCNSTVICGPELYCTGPILVYNIIVPVEAGDLPPPPCSSKGKNP